MRAIYPYVLSNNLLAWVVESYSSKTERQVSLNSAGSGTSSRRRVIVAFTTFGMHSTTALVKLKVEAKKVL
jgi:hypothetical protein